MRRIDRGCFNNRCKTCTLVQSQVFRVHAEICLCRRLNAIRSSSEVNCIQIHGQDFVLIVNLFNLKREVDFLQLTANRFFSAEMGEFGQLLCDGACAFRQRSTL